MASMLLKIMFPPPNLLVTAMSVANVLSMANAGYLEMRGLKHVQYSKFFNADNRKAIQVMPSKRGMLIAYVPALLAASASFAMFPDDEGLRFLLVRSTLSSHFLKRTLEVLFIHRYSGGMAIDSVATISLSYFLYTSILIYSQHLSTALPGSPSDLTYPGIVLFLIGSIGNFYHHYLLSKLRTEGKGKGKEYKVPTGGLFGLAICPHYLFEILAFWGIAFVSQTLFSFSMAIGCTFYLTGRSYATRRWYHSKFEDFPKDIKSLVPFVF